jgi:pyruvate dehydrogenase kinase 2/3/4
VLAEQHLALTETFHHPDGEYTDSDFIGKVFPNCVGKDVIERCSQAVKEMTRCAFGPDVALPEVRIDGHLDVTFPYILSHIEYIIGELLRNSMHAVTERHREKVRRRNSTAAAGNSDTPPPIEVIICESDQHVTIRVSDQGGGIPREVMPHLWSFTKGAATDYILANLKQVPAMAATMQELQVGSHGLADQATSRTAHGNSLATLTSRSPHLRLGMGLPLSRVYAEYWAGSLTLHNLVGHGVDVFLQISKLGNKPEQLPTRASIDAV